LGLPGRKTRENVGSWIRRAETRENVGSWIRIHQPLIEMISQEKNFYLSATNGGPVPYSGSEIMG